MENEDRLISANKLMDAINFEYDLNYGEILTDPRKFADMVEDAPTVDAVEVVRCKDCKHWSDGVAGCTDHVKCCKIGFYMVGENGYCVYGERRNDG